LSVTGLLDGYAGKKKMKQKNIVEGKKGGKFQFGTDNMFNIKNSVKKIKNIWIPVFAGMTKGL